MSDAALVCVSQIAPTPELQQLAAELDIPLLRYIEQIPEGTRYYLTDEFGPLQLVPVNKKQGGALEVDFTAADVEYRRNHSGIRQDIAKAVGCKSQYRPSVIDATAGLGGDAFVLASLGCDMTLVEQNPVVHAMLADGIRRALLVEGDAAVIVSEQMRLIARQSSVEYLKQCQPGSADVVYLDPMFPERKKSAKVKKGMQYFHDIVGLDHEQEAQLLEAALAVAEKRVVVKRPKSAPLLADKKPSYQLKGKAVRYDIYVNS